MEFTQDMVLGIMIGLGVWYVVFKLFGLREVAWHRKDAVNRAKSVVLGHASENIAPLLPSFPFHHKDCVFLGKGVDYVVFDGLYEGDLREIVFVEVKTGTSRLNRNERMVRDVVNSGVVRYEVVKI